MALFFNVFLSAAVISVVLFISKANPRLGGFILSLPVATLITLAFSKIQNQDVGNTFELAKSVFVAVPLSLVFFVPFLFAERFKWSFWNCYFMGIVLLFVSYLLHRWVSLNWLK